MRCGCRTESFFFASPGGMAVLDRLGGVFLLAWPGGTPFFLAWPGGTPPFFTWPGGTPPFFT